MSGAPPPAPTKPTWIDSIITAFLGHAYWLSVGFLRLFGWDLTTGKPYTRTAGEDIEKLAADAFKAFVTSTDTYIEPYIKDLVAKLKPLMAPASTPPIGSAGVDKASPIAFSTSVVTTSGLAAFLMSHFHLDAGEPLTHLAEILSAAVSFEEFRDLEVAPLLRNGIAKVADMEAKKLFQQDLPGASAVASWLARGLIDAPRAQEIMSLNGLHFSLQPIMHNAAYHGMNPRQLLRLIETGLFTQAEIQDELTFLGMRPASQQRMFHAAPYLATQTYRTQLHSALYSAYEAQLLSDADLTSAIDSAETNFDRDQLILEAMHYRVLAAETKKLEVEYSNLYKVGLIDDATYRADLAQLGLQPGYIDIIAGVTEAAANIASYKKNLALAAAEAKATANDERKAAIASFRAGTLNAAGLATALALTGLTPAQVSARVSQATMQLAGSLRTVYGIQLAPAPAALLKQRVADISDQIKAGILKPDLAYPMLTAMQIPANWQNAIVSAAAAEIAAKKGAVFVPVGTG